MNRKERRRNTAARRAEVAAPRADDLVRQALAAFDRGRLEPALTLAERALTLEPLNRHALLLAGMCCVTLRRAERAIELLQVKVRVDPRTADGYVNLGAAYQLNRQTDLAVSAYRQALALDPASVEARSNLGLALMDLGDFAAAEAEFRAALARSPRDANLMHLLASALRKQNKIAEALPVVENAIAVHPRDIKLLVAAGSVLRRLGRVGETTELLDRAVAIAPDDPEIRFRRALHLLSQGDFARGWADYEWRFKRPGSGSIERAFPQPRWRGEALAGKSIVVWSEQGVGDHLVHAPVVRRLAAEGGRVILDADPRLVTMFRRSLPGIEVVPLADPPDPAAGAPDIDYQIPSATVPVYRPDLSTGRHPIGRWLAPDPDRRAAIAERIARAAAGRPIIGIAWKSKAPLTGEDKSSSLTDFEPVLKRAALFVVLQYGDIDAEVAAARAATGADIYVDPEIDRFDDLDGLTALIDTLDIVVTTSNVTVHFAGALGKPTLLALHHGPLWYWHPAVRLYQTVERFRQEKMEDWTPVFAAIAHRLAEMLR